METRGTTAPVASVTLPTMLEEMICATNLAFGMYPGLSYGAYNALKEHGTDWQPGPVLSPMDIFRRVGFDWWHGIEEKFAAR